MASPGAICYRTTMFAATFRVNGVASEAGSSP